MKSSTYRPSRIGAFPFINFPWNIHGALGRGCKPTSLRIFGSFFEPVFGAPLEPVEGPFDESEGVGF